MKRYFRNHGFSLIEVNLAILLVAVGLLALFSLFPLGLKEGERGLADTQEAMFADVVLSGLEGNAMNMIDWADWEDIDSFKAKVKENVQHTTEGGSPTMVTFPDGTRYKIRYTLQINDMGAKRKSATLKVMHGSHGDFTLATVYYTEFIYTGM